MKSRINSRALWGVLFFIILVLVLVIPVLAGDMKPRAYLAVIMRDAKSTPILPTITPTVSMPTPSVRPTSTHTPIPSVTPTSIPPSPTVTVTPVAPPPFVSITYPSNNGHVSCEEVATGTFSAGGPGWNILISVYTNAWYDQWDIVKFAHYPSGVWSHQYVFFGGQGVYNNHTVRAQLVDENGTVRAEATVTGIVRDKPCSASQQAGPGVP